MNTFARHLAVFFCAASILPLAAEVKWETGSYTNWSASADNLLSDQKVTVHESGINYYYEGGKDMVNDPSTLTDGEVPGPDGCDYTKICGVMNGIVSWNLGATASIKEIKIFTRWGDGGRDGIAVKEVSASADGINWVTLAGDGDNAPAPRVNYGVSDNTTSGALFARLYDDDTDAWLIEGVQYVRITFSSTQDNSGTGYAEIEACGTFCETPKIAFEATDIQKRSLALKVTVLGTGAESSGDLYFAYGLNAAALTPAKIAEGLVTEDTFDIELNGLDSGTTYAYSAYLQTATQRSLTLNGTFSTEKEFYRGLPSRYTQVWSVTTTGSQALNTDIKASSTLAAEMDFIPFAFTGDANLGTQAGNDGNDWRFFNYEGGSMFDIGSGRIGYEADSKLVNGTRYTVSIGNAYLEIDSADGSYHYKRTGGTQAASAIASGDIYLAAMGNAGGYTAPVAMSVYSLLITDNGQTVRDFVPCYDNTDACWGLYDMVSGKFFGFVGSDLDKITGDDPVPAPSNPFSSFTTTEVQAWQATLTATVLNDGDDNEDLACDLYFAYGLNANELTPVKVAEGLHEGDTFDIALENLNDSTTYVYAFYIVNGNGVRQSRTVGSFITAWAEPATVTAAIAYYTRSNVVMKATMESFGAMAESADLYFGISDDPDTLRPALYAQNVALDSPLSVSAGELAPDMDYHWTMYAVNDLGRRGPAINGTFHTNQNAYEVSWTGAVDSNWSTPGNWDPVVDLAGRQTADIVQLNSFPAGNPPSNYDVDIVIGRLLAARGTTTPFTISGNQMKINAYEADNSASATITFANDVQFTHLNRNEAYLSILNTKLVFNGVVSDDGQLTHVNSSNNGSVYFNNTNNTFKLPISMHSGTLHTSSDAALGVVDTDKIASVGFGLNNNWGGITFENRDTGKDLNIYTLDSARTLAGSFTVDNSSTDFEFNGTVCMGGGNSYNISGTSRDSRRAFVKLGGDFGDMKGYTVTLNNGLCVVAESETAFGGEDTPLTLKTYFSTFDFNGHDSWNSFYSYTEGTYDPAFINNDLEHLVTLHGTLITDLCCETPLIGGAGAMIHVGAADCRRKDGQDYFAKGDIGSFTLAGPDYSAHNKGSSRLYGGEMVFDYRTYNTFRFLGDGSCRMGCCHLKFLGNDSERTVVEVSSFHQFKDGHSVIETVPGNAGMDFSFSEILQATGSRTLDLRFGDGTAVTVTDDKLANLTGFPGLGAGVTVDGGRNWAYYDAANATVTALPASAFTSNSFANNAVVDITQESITLDSQSEPYAVRFANTTGPATLTLDAQLRMGTHDGCASTTAFIVSPDSAGDVTINGDGEINNTWGNCTMIVHNYLTNHTFSIHARIGNPNNNTLTLVGPGTTVLDNDDNDYYRGPHAYGGQTVKFTSMADAGTSCALGGGHNNSLNMMCADATYEYIGTDHDGHSGNRYFQLAGPVTVKANGAGPLRFTGNRFATSDFASSILTLDGNGEGVIDGSIKLGNYGRLVKQGAGTWTINSTDSAFMYGTEVREGRLNLNGALPSDVTVSEGGTLAVKGGAFVKRSLIVEEGGTLVLTPDADNTPVKVWGKLALGGQFVYRGSIQEDTVVIEAENGIDGEFTAASKGCKLLYFGNEVIAHPVFGHYIILR